MPRRGPLVAAHRIRHVVTYMGATGEFGGPASVALELARSQAATGRAVEIIAGGPVRRPERSLLDGVLVSLFPVRSVLRARLGYASMFAPSLQAYVRATAAGSDQFHIHLARDLVTLPVALFLRRRGLAYLAQTHGMIDASDRVLASVVDAVATGRALRGAQHVAALTKEEEAEVLRLGAKRRSVGLLSNGVRVGDAPDTARQSVLFLARLHPRKGAELFARAATSIAAEHPNIDFVIAGPDEGDGAAVRRVLGSPSAPKNVRYVGPVAPADVRGLMASALIYVLPAKNEPFGLTIIEALSVGTPVILHDSATLADKVVQARAGVSFAGPPEALAQAIGQLLRDEDMRLLMSRNGRDLAEGEFSIERVVDEVDLLYDKRHGGKARSERDLR